MDVLNATEWMEFKLRWNDANYLQEAKKLGLTSANIKDDNATRCLISEFRQVRQTLIWLFLMNVGLTIWEMT